MLVSFLRHNKRAFTVLACALLLATGIGPAQQPARAQTLVDPTAPAGPGLEFSPLALRTGDGELFGMVARDPFYEFNTDPVRFPNQPNKVALERQAAELASLGVRWIRMEFFADYDGSVQPGEINWEKYDWFIRELAPKYNLKVLALLNVGMVAFNGETLRTLAFNDPADGGGSDPSDGSNHFIRVFKARAQTIAARYGTAISAYEIINEPNISFDLWLDSGHGSAEIKPERYAALIFNGYRAIKSVNPLAQVIVGGIMIGSPPEGQDHDQFDYLYQLYTSPWVQKYQGDGFSSRTGWNVVPWDGVAVHPYFLDHPDLFALLREFARKFRDRGDSKSKLWITEIGQQAVPPANRGDSPTEQEIKQSDYLRGLYSGILADSELRAIIPHVFWFKYEDFVPGNYTHNYGLVRLMENEARTGYHSSGSVEIRKLAFRTYQEIARGGAITNPVDEVQVLGTDQLYFGETGQAIARQFTDYWRDNGGLELFGYPISRPVPLNGYLSQFFERAIFEYHPEHTGTPYEVQLRLLGNEFTQGRAFDKADTALLTPDMLYFPETGHTLGGAFLKYWQENGGLPVYGYPISQEITEVSPTDGKEYQVQYFERNRFEYHPEFVGTRFEVQLGLLGANMLKLDLWWR
ncbi:MAG TPA: hypothetical protein VF826_02935 [Chloroflexia bacterium]|jgi:hypothetical protein